MQNALIHCIRKKFSEYCLETSVAIRSLNADPEDDFAFLMFEDLKGVSGFNVGFNKTLAGIEIYDNILLDTYALDLKNKEIYQGCNIKSNQVIRCSDLFLAPKNESVFEEITRYKKYKLDLAKLDIYKRHGKEFELYSPLFSSLFESEKIDRDVYCFFKKNCLFIIHPYLGGEHGRFAFNVFSSNLDDFFSKLKKIIGNNVDLKFHSSLRDLPCT